MLQTALSVMVSVALAYVAWLFAGMLFDGPLRVIVGVIAALACMGGGGYLGFRSR